MPWSVNPIERNIASFRKKLNDVANPNSFMRGKLTEWAPLLFLILIATVWLYRTPFSASNLEVPPDTVEYALAPLQFLETGDYKIIVEGRPLPPRYPPWFPILAILPAYVLFGHEPGNAILPVTLIAVAGVGFAWGIGKRLGSAAGGILAGLALLFLPSYGAWATQVMSDVPGTALMLATCLLYLRLRAGPRSIALYFRAGVLVALATLVRPVFAAMLFPFLLEILRTRQRLVRSTAALLLPIAVAAAVTLAYNATTFGSPLRNGYKFWVAIPMDYPSLIFSLSYLKMNLGLLGHTVLPYLLAACIAAWLIVRKREGAALASSRQTFQDLLTFLVLTTGPILLFHLFYFFPSDRFHIPTFAGAAVFAGGMLGLLFRPRTTLLLKWLLPAVLLLAIGARIAVPEPVPHRRLAAERVRAHTPDNALIISAIEPVYLERLAGHGSSRRIVPISRYVEYASKLLVRKRVDLPNPSALNWRDSRLIDLRRAGAVEAVQFVASEQLDALVTQAAAGTPIFLDSTFVGESDAEVLNQLQQRFKFVQRAPFLYQLQLP
jgi:4-amino-4-deoxy-L-arabinose transferase-like glycosyltransferase